MKKSAFCAATLISAALAATSAKAAQVIGTTVSSYYGNINWSEVAGDGIDFVFARATEGTEFEDPKYPSYMTNGKAAGLQMGAYEFAQTGVNTSAEEANYFWSYAGSDIKSDGKSISPMIDFEIFSGHVGTSTYTEWFNDWSKDVQAKTSASMQPVIFISPCAGACDLSTSITLGAFVGNPVGLGELNAPWNQCADCNAWDPDGTGGWTYWMYSDTGSITGISGETDLVLFNGSLASLKSDEGVGGK